MTGREDYDLKLFAHAFEESHCIGADINSNLNLEAFDGDVELDIGFDLSVFIAVNESLVEVQDESFFVLILFFQIHFIFFA
jgi:hypothetical protein